MLRDSQLDAHQQDPDTADEEKQHGHQQVHDPDLLMIDGRYPLKHTLVGADAEAGKRFLRFRDKDGVHYLFELF